jgi:hypothetical protein
MVKESEIFNNIKCAIGLPSLRDNSLFKKGRNILDSRSDYEEFVHKKISQYSLPSIPQIYSNGEFKTNVYKIDEPSPCLDDIFYKHENLIPYGKEYWFAIFNGMDRKKPMQLVSCFGRRNSRRSIVDDIEVNGLNSITDDINTGAFAWCYNGFRKLAVPTREAITHTGEKSIVTKGDGISIDISGTVPEYHVKVNSKPINCDFTLKKPSKGYDTEVLNELKMGLNYQVYNLYYDFEGILNKKEYAGKCYLQKVILSTPLVPWYWSRLVFNDGSSFVFFKPYFGSKDLQYSLRNKGVFYSAQHDRLFTVYNLDVKHEAWNSTWKVSSQGPDYSLNIAVKAYAHHRFSFKSGGSFNYNEYLVNVKKFDFVSGDVKVNVKSMGPGAGMFEDATGILI